jgi:hypothetical protein
MKIQITLLSVPSTPIKIGTTFRSILTPTGTISSLLVSTKTRLISPRITSTSLAGKSAPATIVDGICKVVGTGLGELKSNAKREDECVCRRYRSLRVESTRGKRDMEGEEAGSKGIVDFGVVGERRS